MPFAVKICGYMGIGEVRFLSCLKNIPAKRGRTPKGKSVRWPMQLLSVTVRGNAEMYHRSGLMITSMIIPREESVRYDAGFEIPVLIS